MSISPEKLPVSVVIPCFRCRETIVHALESVRNQTALPAEVILVDDCSADGTLQVLEKIVAQYHDGWLKLVTLDKNAGPGTARNAGWEVASSAYIAFLDADDAWHPKKLELQYGWMHAHPDVVLTGHGTMWLGNKGMPPLPAGELTAWPVSGQKFLLSNRFPTRSVMVRSDVPFRFCPGKRYAEDSLLWLQIILSGYPAWRIVATLAFSYKPDFGGAGLSANLWKHEKGELDTYTRLFREKLIPARTYYPVVVISLLKFLRRVLISAARKYAA